MKLWKKPTNEMIDSVLGSIKKEVDRQFFFARLRNPLWIRPLVERGCYQSPPKVKKLPGEYIQTPIWPELRYLKNVADDAPEEVLKVVLELPEVDNPRVYDDILDIALQLHGEQSAKLIKKVLESTEIDYLYSSQHRLTELLKHWTTENQFEAALKLTETLVQFVPDRQDKTKRKRRRKTPTDTAKMATMVVKSRLEPAPRVDRREYRRMLSKGVRPLAEKEPYKVALSLINATVNMIRLRTHQEDLLNGIDYSESWCDRLTESEGDYEDAEKSLIQTLTFACVQVYEKLPQLVSELDRTLREQQLRAFKRLRYHLCAQHPNETTKPWIQQLIREHKGYDWLQHGYEFQRMVRRACEHFGNTLVTKEECIRIFDSILDGPSETNHRVWVEDFLDEEFTEDRFIIHTRRFHRMQLRPFECVLFGKYATYFRDLEHEAGTSISDEDYGPRRIQTSYGPNDHSPIAHDDLANYDDEELLHYINDWDNPEVFYDGKKYMRINVEGLSQAFETIFKKSIIPNSSRLMFWMGNLEMVERPIFLERMLAAMRERIETNNLDKLNDWLVFCNRVLLHTEHQMANDRKQADESSEVPEWYSLRWTVGDFIRVCLDRDTDMPVSAQEQLGNLLDTLCTQFDWYLDRETTLNRLQTDLADTGINNPRGKALKDLINFGFWLRRHKLDSESRGVTKILEKRFATDSQYSLTLPEYAILGMSYSQILSLDRKWAIRNKSNFFPKDARSQWLAAFGSYVDYNRASEPAFEILREEYSFALQLLDDFNKQHRTEDIPTGIFDGGTRENNPEEKLMSILGRHFFIYYLWEMYPLKGKSSLLERYYRVTDGNRERWGDLFEWVGRTLRDTSQQLEQNLIDRIIDYFDWRLQVKEPVELKQFNSWLEAKCLAAHWRLDACAKVLEVCKTKGVSIILPIDALCEMLPDCTAKVVACFARLTDDIGDDNIYIYTDEAITILSAGLGSSDHDVLQNAERARENLLRIGRFDLMELGD